MATAITIQGGSGSDTINYSFVVTGTNTSRYAVQFSDTVNALLAGGDPLVYVQSSGADALLPSGGAQTHIYDLIPSTVNGGNNVFNIFAPGYVVDSVNGGAFVNIAGGDTVIVAGQNSQSTISAALGGEKGNNDLIVFVSGDNEYIGDTASGGGSGDTIVAGAGLDTISTGGGSATVNSGTGNATIYLNDTLTGSTINQYVWLDDGRSVVYANGQNDAVIATGAGQTVFGGSSTSSELSVVLTGASTGDLINGGAGATTVYEDSAGGNTIVGGSGGLFFVGGLNVTDTILGGGGETLIYGNSGENLTFANQLGTSGGLTEMVAGGGDETLNGATAVSNLALFAAGSTSANDVLTGGYGNDTLVAGMGSDTLTGGAGANVFLLDASSDAGGNITIADFGASAANTLEFGGYSPSDVAAALSSGTESNGNFSITLSDNTTVTFTGITSASELTGHIVTF